VGRNQEADQDTEGRDLRPIAVPDIRYRSLVRLLQSSYQGCPAIWSIPSHMSLCWMDNIAAACTLTTCCYQGSHSECCYFKYFESYAWLQVHRRICRLLSIFRCFTIAIFSTKSPKSSSPSHVRSTDKGSLQALSAAKLQRTRIGTPLQWGRTVRTAR